MVYHILKDGSRPTDITGHVVKLEDAAPLYRYLRNLTYERNKRGIHNESGSHRRVITNNKEVL